MTFLAVIALHASAAQAGLPAIHLSQSEFAAQYGTIRAMEEAKETPEAPGLRKAVEDLAALQHRFPSRIKTRAGQLVEAEKDGRARVDGLYWRTLDALTFSAESAEGLNRIPDIMPKVGGELDASDAFGTIRKALDESKDEFASKLWPSERSAAQSCIDSFDEIPPAKRDAAIRFILQTAGIKKQPNSIEMLIVPRMAGPEGMTVRTMTGPLVIIGAGKYRGSDFDEVVLHEATHVFDTVAGTESLFGELRAAAQAANRSAFDVEEVPHTAMFLLAAEAIRLFVDPKHKDVGETFGIYARGLDRLCRVERPILKDLESHRIGADEAVKRIIDRRSPQFIESEAYASASSAPRRAFFIYGLSSRAGTGGWHRGATRSAT
ncbi:MAG TPA: hypothetical protein VMI31_00760 [Fimbriimonadaceae bacterium]|nr:hypothetical protein [Fimbriimonadaceae bacterium]